MDWGGFSHGKEPTPRWLPLRRFESWVGFRSSHGVLRQVRRTIPWFNSYPIRLPDAPSSHVNFDVREFLRVNYGIG